ncbi:MAG: helix-turn-helix domain-containing protein [Planctomycetaceae bacterium]|nr:helix-turn-helix domain-containing protein [Planctomycetaceae bacterium]
MQELIPLTDASIRLGIHVTTLRAWVRNGAVPAYRVGRRFIRVDWNELLAAIQLEQRVGPFDGQPVPEAVPDQISASTEDLS